MSISDIEVVMLKALKALLTPAPQSATNNSLTRATTPDKLIVSALLDRYLKKNDGFTWAIDPQAGKDKLIAEGQGSYYEDYAKPKASELTDTEKGITVFWTYTSDKRKIDKYSSHHFSVLNRDKIVIRKGDVEIVVEGRDAREFTNRILLYREQLAATRAAAAKAKAEMEANEAKWNLAEELLGMVRNASGALVPVNSVQSPVPDEPPVVFCKACDDPLSDGLHGKDCPEYAVAPSRRTKKRKTRNEAGELCPIGG